MRSLIVASLFCLQTEFTRGKMLSFSNTVYKTQGSFESIFWGKEVRAIQRRLWFLNLTRFQ